MTILVYIFMTMVTVHILADFVFQGQMGVLKEKAWWEKHYPEYMGERGKCRYDYVMVLFLHGFSWSFMVMVPIAYYLDFDLPGMFYVILWANGLCHALVDDLKVNHKIFGLVTDQILHIIQLLGTLSWVMRWTV